MRREVYDWPSRADERRRSFAPQIIDAEFRVIETRPRRPTASFMSCVLIVGVAAAIALRFAWGPILMGFILIGVTEPRDIAAAVVGLVILGAAWLRHRF
jgi:hypothetical protein